MVEDSGGGVGSASYVGLKMDFDSLGLSVHVHAVIVSAAATLLIVRRALEVFHDLRP